MADYVDTFLAALRTAVVAHWTDVATTGVHLWEEIADDAFEDLAPPYAVVEVGELEWDEEYAAGNKAYQSLVDVNYIRTKNQTQAALRSKLEGLRDYLFTNGISGVTLLDITGLSYTLSEEVNRGFANRAVPHRGGRVQLLVLMGET